MQKVDAIRNLIASGYVSSDIEFGNSEGYYSFSNHSTEALALSPCDSDREIKPILPGTDVEIADNRRISDEEYQRVVGFRFCGVSKIYDLVSRFVVYSFNDRPATIDNKLITHRSSNIYYQYPAKNVRVPVAESSWLDFNFTFTNDIEGMESVCYIRDETKDVSGYRWIVHQRMIADPGKTELIVRSCNPRYEGVLPLQALYPHWMKKKLFRIRENKYPSFPVMAVGEATVDTGVTCDLEARIRVVTT
ncbi:hypothetical protein LG302_08880 [Halomonas organivorans]